MSAGADARSRLIEATEAERACQLRGTRGPDAPVRPESQHPGLGILTERDIVELLFNGVDLDETAEQHARKHLITTKSDRTIGYALNLMIDNNIRRMIVLDEENALGHGPAQPLCQRPIRSWNRSIRSASVSSSSAGRGATARAVTRSNASRSDGSCASSARAAPT